MKSISIKGFIVCLIFLPILSCNGKVNIPNDTNKQGLIETQVKPPQEKPDLRDVFERTLSDQNHLSYKPNEFYVTLGSETQWKPNSNRDCVDQGFWSWLRKFVKVQDAAEVALIAELNSPSMQEKLTLPIFTLGMNEAAAPGQPSCYSNVIERELITPALLATKLTRFDVELKVYHSKNRDFNAANTLVNLSSKLLNEISGSSSLISTFSTPFVKNLIADLDESLHKNWTQSSEDKYSTQIHVFPLSNADSSTYYDTIQMNASKIRGQAFGLKLGNEIPFIKLRLNCIESLFASGGKYPEDPYAIISSAPGTISGTQKFAIADVLRNSGFNGVTKNNLNQTNNQEQLVNYCTDLREEFSAHLSRRDALAARFSVINAYCPYYKKSPEARESNCFSENELNELAAIGKNYIFPDLARENNNRRDNEIGKLMDSAVKAIRSGDVKIIQNAFSAQSKNHFITILPGTQLPAQVRNKSWDASEEETCLKVAELSKKISKIGCWRAPQNTKLINAAAVVLINDAALGAAFHFDDKTDKIEGITIGSFDRIRKQYDFPNDWPGTKSECALID